MLRLCKEEINFLFSLQNYFWRRTKFGVVTISFRHQFKQHQPSRFLVLYTDGILLAALSLTVLQSLFEMCELELFWLDVCINTQKSCSMRTGNYWDVRLAQDTAIDSM